MNPITLSIGIVCVIVGLTLSVTSYIVAKKKHIDLSELPNHLPTNIIIGWALFLCGILLIISNFIV